MNYRVGMMALALAAAFTGNVQAGSHSFSFSIPYSNLELWPGALLVGEVDPARDNRDNLQFTISGVVDITGSKMRKVGNRFLYENVDIKESFLNEEYVTNPHDAKLWLSEKNGEKKFSALQITYDQIPLEDFKEEKDAVVVTLSKSLSSSPDLELTFRATEKFLWACSECTYALLSTRRDASAIQFDRILHGFIINDKNFHWQALGSISK